MPKKTKQPKPRNPMFVRKATMTINDKREKVAKRRHEHEIFQAKLLRKEATGLPWLGTFHSISAKILRKHADAVSLKSNFTIIDQDDQTRLVKNICKAENIDIKQLSPRFVLAIIDRWKNKGFYPEDVILKKRETLEKNFLNIYKIYRQF